MDAYICDRCGRSYPISNRTMIQATRSGEIETTRRIGQSRLPHVDLCPRCILAFDAFIDGYAKEVEECVE